MRKVDAKDLVARAGEGLPLPKKGPASGKVLDTAKIAGIFGIEMAEIADAAPPLETVTANKKTLARKNPVTPKKKKAPAKKKVNKQAV